MMHEPIQSGRPPLIVPSLGRIYSGAWVTIETVLRLVAGLALVTHGASKIVDPFGASGMVEGIGFYPGPLWSLLLSVTEFFGGIFVAIGLLTRPSALAACFVLLVTVYFHWVLQGEGWAGAEKSVIWATVMLYFVIRGANSQSVDAKIGRQF